MPPAKGRQSKVKGAGWKEKRGKLKRRGRFFLLRFKQEQKGPRKKFDTSRSALDIDISTRLVDQVIDNFVEKKKNWEEQGQNYLDAAPRPGFNMDVTGCDRV